MVSDVSVYHGGTTLVILFILSVFITLALLILTLSFGEYGVKTSDNTRVWDRNLHVSTFPAKETMRNGTYYGWVFQYGYVLIKEKKVYTGYKLP